MNGKFFQIVLVVLAVAVVGVAGLVAPAFAGTAEEEAIAGVMAAEKARGAALLAADTNALGKLLAEDFQYTHSDGKHETKATHIGSIAGGLRYAKFETSDLTGQIITSDVVVLKGVIEQRKGTGGKDSRLTFHALWRRKGAAWELVSLQTAVGEVKK